MLKPNHLSDNGAHRLQNAEGLRLAMYFDAFGHPTIGYGHLIRPEEHGLYMGMFASISPAQAQALFEKDIQPCVNAVNQRVTVPLNQNQFDALVSFVFNVGISAFVGSHLLKLLNAGKFALVPDELMRWVHDDHGNVCKGLQNRRLAEATLFKQPISK